MPCYNAGPFVREALESVLSQDYEGNLQLVVVDDCSTDNSLEVIQDVLGGYQGPVETLLLRNEVNRGVAATVDVAVAHAKYEWIIEADADDVQLSTRCRDTADLIRQYPLAQMVILSAINVDENGTQYSRTNYCLGNEGVPDELYLDSEVERVRNYTGCAIVGKISAYGCFSAYRRSNFLRWGKLAELPNERIAQDPPIELRCILSGPIVGSMRIACHYRCHSGNLLNRARKWDTLNAWKEHEVFRVRYSKFNARTYEAMLRDVQKAVAIPELTDWTESHLRNLESMLRRMCYTARMEAAWWDMNVLHRILWWCFCRNKVMDNMRPWFRNRLLPFHLACWLRFKLHQRRG